MRAVRVKEPESKDQKHTDPHRRYNFCSHIPLKASPLTIVEKRSHHNGTVGSHLQGPVLRRSFLIFNYPPATLSTVGTNEQTSRLTVYRLLCTPEYYIFVRFRGEEGLIIALGPSVGLFFSYCCGLSRTRPNHADSFIVMGWKLAWCLDQRRAPANWITKLY
jgi:hypothetical protein